LFSHGIVVGWSGRPLYSRPRTARGARPLCFSPCGSHGSELRQVEGLCRRLFKAFIKSRRREKQWNEIFFFPCLARPGEQEDPQCRSKRHRLGLFFFEIVDETTSFWTKRTISFKRKWRQNCVKVPVAPSRRSKASRLRSASRRPSIDFRFFFIYE